MINTTLGASYGINYALYHSVHGKLLTVMKGQAKLVKCERLEGASKYKKKHPAPFGPGCFSRKILETHSSSLRVRSFI
jgi:hypothetical protein